VQELAGGPLDKLDSEFAEPVRYRLPIGELRLPLNELVGSVLRIEYLGVITCANCQRRTRRSFAQGFCFPCFQRLARCDSCIVKPESCHYDQGSCREPQWGERFCMQEHLVYLANSSGLKVGITRASQVPTRWIDQGAVQALPILRVRTRQQSGFVEVAIASSVADKTNWRAMLRNDGERLDLRREAEAVLARHRADIDALRGRFGAQAIEQVDGIDPLDITYPVNEYPEKPVSLNLDRTPVVEGVLKGIKGQYLIFDTGVLNIRNFTSYHVRVSAGR